MCGIAAIIGNTTEQELMSLLGPIKHRGSQHFQYKIFKCGTMGCNRLPIVGGLDSHQPASNAEKTIFAVMNGEIFNHIRLRQDLIGKGYQIKGDSDTDLIPALYQEYGSKFIEHIDSEMFVVVVYDSVKDKWLVYRDPLGVKPLYYLETPEKTYFASEAKQLVGLAKSVDIKIFPPGSFFTDGKFSKYELSNEAAANIQTGLDEAVKKRIPHERFGIFLSGGIDSSAVLATTLKFTDDFEIFIVGTPDSSDRDFAIRLCDYFSLDYHLIEPVKPRLSDVKSLVEIVETDEINTIRHSWVSYLVARKAAELGLKVVLCGEGADEIFGGYEAFFSIPEGINAKARKMLTTHLHLTQLPRLDRTSMHFTLEVRCPFLDQKLVNLALSLDSTNIDGNKATKEVLRKAMLDRLPSWITEREKVPFSTGAGITVDGQQGSIRLIALSQEQTEQGLLSQIYTQKGYDAIVKPEAINKDNLLQVLGIQK